MGEIARKIWARCVSSFIYKLTWTKEQTDPCSVRRESAPLFDSYLLVAHTASFYPSTLVEQ